jgi:hypothetical protein
MVHEEDKSGRVEAGNEREGSAFHACRGYGPKLGWAVRLDRSLSAPANQCASGCAQNAQLLVRPMKYLASAVQHCQPDSGSGSLRAPRHRHSPYPSNADPEASAAPPGAHAPPRRCPHQPSWRWWESPPQANAGHPPHRSGVKWTDVTCPGSTFLATVAGLNIIGGSDQHR